MLFASVRISLTGIGVSDSDLVQPICRCGARVTAPNNHNIGFLGEVWCGLEIFQGRLGGLNPVGLGWVADGEYHGVDENDHCLADTIDCLEQARDV